MSSTSSVTSTYSSLMRLGGLGGSGLDTDAIVKQLMKAEEAPLNKIKQKKQLAEWKQDDYRSISSLLRELKDTYFNLINPSTNMLSQSLYKKFAVTSTDSTVVTAVSSADTVSGNHSITVSNVAAGAVNQSSSFVTKQVQGTSAANYGTAVGKNFVINIDGVQKTINIDGSVTNVATFQALLDTNIGPGKVDITDVGGGILKFTPRPGSGVNKITLSPGTNDALSALGFCAGANLSNRLNVGDTLDVVAANTNTAFTFDSNNKLSITVNGKSFQFDKTTTSLSSMMSQINSDTTANVLMQYDDVNDVFKFTAKQMGAGTNLQITEAGSTFLTAANMNGITGTGSASAALQNYTLSNKEFSVVIDGIAKDITLDADYTGGYGTLTSSIKSKIEAAFTGKTVSVSQNAGILSISLTSGGSSLSIGAPSSGTSALTDLGLTANYTAGVDAKVTLDGQLLTRSSNTFAVNGVTYSLLKSSATQQTVSVSQDTNSVYDNIKNFVDKYNEVIDKINTKLNEKYDRNYQPLTDDQKSGMKDDEITKWETKAKTGLLKNDPILQDVVYNMRRALSDSVTDSSGSSINLSSIGITTGPYQDNGKLVIDENKLSAAIQNDPDTVANLFTKQSSVSYSAATTSELRTQRYNEEGLAYRLSDILDDNIRTTSGKGSLLLKAGITGDTTEFTSLIYNEINGYDKDITSLTAKLADKESAYYAKFTAMESALSRMNAQSSWLFSQSSSTHA